MHSHIENAVPARDGEADAVACLFHKEKYSCVHCGNACYRRLNRNTSPWKYNRSQERIYSISYSRVDDVTLTNTGTTNHPGELSGDIVEAPSSGNGVQNVIEAPKKQDEESIFWSVEIESSYPGGVESWKRFLLKNFRPHDEVSGTVIVQFIVDKEGNVSDVKAISGPDELQAEAVRVIKKSGKWTPAIQNGRKVNSYKKQPITVQIVNE